MKSINVYITGDANNNVTALQGLPPTWVNGDSRYNIHRGDPWRHVVDGKFSTNAELVIRHDFQVGAILRKPHEKIPFSGEIIFARLSKSYQQAWLNLHHLGPCFKVVPTWTDVVSAVIEPDKFYCIKPEHGARGIGFLVFSSNITTPFKMIKFLEDTVGEDAVKRQRAFQRKLGKDKDALAHYISVRDRVPGEGYQQLTGGHSVVLQECVENIVEELRVITDEVGRVAYMITRARNVVSSAIARSQTGDGSRGGDLVMRQGVGNGEVPERSYVASDNDNCNVDDWIKKGNDADPDPERTDPESRSNLIKEAVRRIEGLRLPLHSFDVFFTGKVIDSAKENWRRQYREWGIFEFCPQYGLEAVPIRAISGAAKRYIENQT